MKGSAKAYYYHSALDRRYENRPTVHLFKFQLHRPIIKIANVFKSIALIMIKITDLYADCSLFIQIRMCTRLT